MREGPTLQNSQGKNRSQCIQGSDKTTLACKNKALHLTHCYILISLISLPGCVNTSETSRLYSYELLKLPL